MRGKEFIEYDNPYDVGMTGLLGFSSGYYAIMDSDVLLMLGTDFPYQQFYPENTKVIQVDIRGEQIGRRTKVDLGLIGDVGRDLIALSEKLGTENSTGGTSNLHLTTTKRPGMISIHLPLAGKAQSIPNTLRRFSMRSRKTMIFSCDVGTPTIWAARYLQMNGRGDFSVHFPTARWQMRFLKP